MEHLRQPVGCGPSTKFAVIPDATGGSQIELGIVEYRAHQLVDAIHHPPGQSSPTNGAVRYVGGELQVDLDHRVLSGLLALVPGDVPLVFIGAQTFAHYHHTNPGVSGMVRYAGGEVQVTFNHHTIALEITMNNAPALHLGDFIL